MGKANDTLQRQQTRTIRLDWLLLRVLGTNSLFMSLPVAMDSIPKTRAAVCGSLVKERTGKINLRATAYLL